MAPIPVRIELDGDFDDKDVDDKDAEWEDLEEGTEENEEFDEDDSDYQDYPGLNGALLDYFNLWIESSKIPMAIIDQDTQSDELKSEVYLLLLGLYDNTHARFPLEGIEYEKVLKGLLLRPCGENLFRRIGAFQLGEEIPEFESIIDERGLCRGKSNAMHLAKFDPNSENACIISII
jgi:hypothetical protein